MLVLVLRGRVEIRLVSGRCLLHHVRFQDGKMVGML
jgi:hypothetical protein